MDLAIDLVKEQDGIDPQRILSAGCQSGGLVSALVAGNRPDKIEGLFLAYPAMYHSRTMQKRRYASLEEVPDEVEIMGLTVGKTYYQYLLDYNFQKEIRKYKGKVFIFHGDNDEIVDASYSERAATMYDNAKLYILHGEGHGFSKKIQRLLARFIINEILGAAKASS